MSITRKRRNILLSLFLSALLLLGAFPAFAQQSDVTTRPSQVLPVSQVPPVSQVQLTLEQILEIVKAAYPGATAVKASLEDEKGTAVYEIELVLADGSLQTLTVAAADGEILKTETESAGTIGELSGIAKRAALASRAAIGMDAAVRAALVLYPNATVTEAVLSDEGGTVVFRVTLTASGSGTLLLLIDAADGTVLGTETVQIRDDDGRGNYNDDEDDDDDDDDDEEDDDD